MSTAFNVKITPRKLISDFINYHEWKQVNVGDFSGRIVYMNYHHPGHHIYSAYYVANDTAHPLNYSKNGVLNNIKFSLNELSDDSIIIFWTQEDVNKKEAADKVKQNSKP